MDEGRFRTLHALRVKGMSTPEVAAEIVALPVDEVEGHLQALSEAGLARFRGAGRVQGWSLTKDGKAEHAEVLPGTVDDATRAELDAAYREFLPVNGDFKQVCNAWQLRSVAAGEDVPNTHDDPDYDAEVIERLSAVDERVGRVLDGLTVARMAGYRARLTGALERVRAGEPSAFTAPMSSSYHDVWMELHQDLILSLGRTRDAADEG